MEIDRHEVGPRFAQLVVRGETAYIAGQIADSADADIGVQTAEVLAKLDRMLAAIGSSKAQLLSTTVWLADFADYERFNEVWEDWVLPDAKPARATVRAELLNPRLRVEIAAVAAVPAVMGASARLVDDAAAEIDFIEPAEATQRLRDERLVFVDVRDRPDYEEGHVPGAVHASRGLLEFHLDPASDMHVPELTSGRTLVMVCGSGGRATLATRLAQGHGLSARCLRGGMRSWRDAGGEVAGPPDA